MPETESLSEVKFPAKMQCLFIPKRYKIFHGGRGGAKTWNFARALIIRGMTGGLRVLCVREFQKSIDDSVYATLKDQIRRFGLEGSHYRILQSEIVGVGPAAGTTFNFEGVKNNPQKVKSYEGIDVCWVEEAAKVTKESWNILIPTIRKEGSEIWVSFNPELETDYTYQNFIANPLPESDAFTVEIGWRDNPWFPPALEKERLLMLERDPDEYQHVYEGKCRTILAGAVYAAELRLVVATGRLTKVPVNPALPIDVIFDLGWADATALWFRQKTGFEWHYVDYLEGQQKPFTHYVREIQNKGYLLGQVILPHDARAKEKGTGKSIEELARQHFPGKVRIAKKLSVEDGINAGREHLPLCYFDRERCGSGFTHLQRYRYEVDDNTSGHLSRQPVHDEHSHAADAFRYSAVTAKAGALTRATRDEVSDSLGIRPKLRPRSFTPSLAGNVGWMGR